MDSTPSVRYSISTSNRPPAGRCCTERDAVILKTLHGYLIRDLMRVTLLATIAFTLVMTVFAIVEPLRKQGLATGQVAQLFIYTLPVMLSLTLPFAALFATSIVYGRFSMDRELLACRASGISTITVLHPALMLGATVTIIALLLTNFVSPRMARAAQESVVANIKRIAAHKIRKESHVEIGDKYVIHATHAEIDEQEDLLILGGVVAGRFMFKKDPKTGITLPVLQALVASSAYLKTYRDPDTNKYYASIFLTDQVGPITNEPGGQVESREVPLENIELENPAEEKASFYDWTTLIAMLADPTRHGEIQRKMEEFRRKIRHNRVMTDLAETLRSGEPYRQLSSEDARIIITAPQVVTQENRATLLSRKRDDGTTQPVQVRLVSPAGSEMLLTAGKGEVIARWSPAWRKSEMTLNLSGGVVVQRDGGQARQENWSRGQIPLPPDPEFESATISQIYQQPEQYTDDRQILEELEGLKLSRPPKIQGEIIAEMHSRLAFGLSCVLLVALGAALGVVFKGGQLLSAFTISVLPAAGYLVLVLMGKKMISNPDSSDVGGIIAIWGGLLLLGVVDGVLYYRLSKR
jgi:lipopolysaccharide export LptBFGC system permease protein LptF